MGGLKSFFSRVFAKDRREDKRRLKLLLWASLAGAIFGAIEFGEPLEDKLRIGRNWVRQHEASGQIVVVGFDEKSLDRMRRLNNWPWPRRYHAELTDELNRLGAREILFDLDFSAASDPKDDQIFAEALARSNVPVTLAIRFLIDPTNGKRTDNYPIPKLREHAGLAQVNFRYNAEGDVWELPYALHFGGRPYPSFAAEMAHVSGPPDRMFPIDYAVDPSSIPAISAIDLIDGKVPANQIRGKTVVIGTTALDLGDVYFFPGYEKRSGVYLHVLGAETLLEGVPLNGGWLLPYLLALLLAILGWRTRRRALAVAIFGGGVVFFISLPLVLEMQRIWVEVTPALFLLLTVGGSLAWSNFRQLSRAGATTHPLTGLPNLNMLRGGTEGVGRPLVAVRIKNYPEVASALPPSDEKALLDQVVSRLRVGNAEATIFQGEEGIFAWFTGGSSGSDVADHLEALHALFRSPVVVAQNQMDLTISFGVDTGMDRSLSNRLASALVAADEAAAEGLRWKHYDPAKLKEAVWKLSLLSQLDAAIERGELWVAYQPKLDLKTNRITGAEALVRWSHPEKGFISPLEFVLAAEQNNRIEKLTAYVLERAIRSAAVFYRRGIELEMSVNLSARLIDDPSLVSMVTGLLKRHNLPPDRLTLEVTETAALNSHNTQFEGLLELRYLGVQISIDDYGTGLSTLDYLKRIPATEIKIDKSFVQSLGRSQSDKLLVNSTIQLAHALGHKVVAEGVEEEDTLEALKGMGCDVAQGYLIGRPMGFDAFKKQFLQDLRQRAA
jgi:EAL domain-containing protein (putative c-di-GMP-specific phosphodiesterase class I)/CHASE2 domain-containing sensor protein